MILLVLTTGITTLQFTRADRNSSGWVLHTQEVLSQLARVDSTITQAETGQRGYLLTGDQSYLGPYQSASESLNATLQELGVLIADNHDQEQRFEHLRDLTNGKMDELKQTVELFQNGRQREALDVVRSNRGRDLMAEIRETTAAMQHEELRLLTDREQQSKRATRNLVAVTVAGMMLNVALLIVVLMANRRLLREERERAAVVATSERRFRTTLTSIGDAVITTDRNGNVSFVNNAAENVLGRSSKECIGRTLKDIFHIFNEQTGAAVENPVERVLATGSVVGLANHTVLRRPDGSTVPIEDSAAPILDDDGKIVGVVFVFRDVTKERDTMIALRQVDRLSVAGRLAATVAHEINNPLEAIINITYLALQDEHLPAQVKSLLRTSEKELKRVAHITNQMLRFHRTKKEITTFNVADLVDGMLDLFAPRFARNQVQIVKHYEVGVRMTGSPDDLQQIVSNLLVNSLDAMPAGGTLTLNIGRADSTANSVMLTVSDTGCGIDPSLVGRVFDAFFTTKEHSGTGLGLWVVQTLVDENNGTIAINSSTDHGATGTTVQITLPVVRPQQAVSA